MLISNQVRTRNHHYHHKTNGIISPHKKMKLHEGLGELPINADEGKRHVCSRMLNYAVDDEPQNPRTSTNHLQNFYSDVYLNTMKNLKENVIICRSAKNFDKKLSLLLPHLLLTLTVVNTIDRQS